MANPGDKSHGHIPRQVTYHHKPTEPRKRIGAKRDQFGRIGPGAQPALPNGQLSAPHDWSAFDAFKRMNQRPVGTVTSAAPAAPPVAPSPAPSAPQSSAFAPAMATFSPVASLALGAAEALGATPRSTTTPAPAAPSVSPARPTSPGQQTTADGQTITIGAKGTTIEYDPTKNQNLNRTVERVPGTDEARVSMPVDPRYGGGTAFATGVRSIPRQDNERFVPPTGPTPEVRDPLMLAALKARTPAPVASAPAPARPAAPVAAPSPAPTAPVASPAPVSHEAVMAMDNALRRAAGRVSSDPSVNISNALGSRIQSAWSTPDFEGWYERRMAPQGGVASMAPRPAAPSALAQAEANQSAFEAARPAIDAFHAGIKVPQTAPTGLPVPGLPDPEEERRKAALAGR